MKFKHTAILLGLVLVAVVGLIAYSMNQPEEATVGDVVFPGLAGLNATDIDTLEFVRTQPKDEKVVYTRTGDEKRWKVTSPVTANVEQRELDSLVEAVLKLKPVKFDELKADPKAHGLDVPTVKLTLRQGSAKTATLNVGLTTIGGEKAVTFITTTADPTRPLAVKKSDLAPLFKNPTKADGEAWANAKSLTDFRPRRLLGVNNRDPLTETMAVRVRTGSKELSLKLDGISNWQFVVPDSYGDVDPGGDTEVNPDVFTGVRPLLNYLTTVQVQSTADVIESPTTEDLAKFGLKGDDNTMLRIELTTKSGTESLDIGKQVEGDMKPAKRYVRLDGDSCVAMVPIDRFDSLLRTVADPNEMRNRDLVSISSYERIDALDIAVGPNVVKLRKFGAKEKTKWYLIGGTGDPKEANFVPVDQILQAVTRPRAAIGFPAKPDPAAFAANETKATITIWRDALGTTAVPEAGKPMPDALKGEPIVLTFGKKDGAAILLKKTEKGRSSEFKVPEAFVNFAALGRLNFLSAGVTSFPTNKVAKATFARPSGAVEVVKATGAPDPNFPLGKWTFAQPADRKDKIADQPKTDALLGVVSYLRANQVVNENPGEAEVKTYGFTPTPRMKVSLELNDEPGKIRGYEFGSETSDGGFVYARHSGSTHVYTVPKADVVRMLTDDLRDSILYRIDRSKLNGFTIRGWSGTIPVPPTHEYVRTGVEWTCKAPPGATADPARIAAFLGHVEQPRAVRFLGPIKPEYKLDVANGAVEIAFMQEGSAPVVLLLGAETDGGLNYIASVSTLPGEAVVIQAAAIRVLAGTPTGLIATPKPVVPTSAALPTPEKK